ncbi:Probable allantoinase 1 [Durusdinium trenchii]|uniref:allantoinase n=1 Tax=Durusdinium trenchii TaxID=1381693 RepID=A0ABP0LE33_9DINO
MVDVHVHLNEPGRSEWEGFETGTAAAAAGGVTLAVDMPLNSSPVTTTLEALAAKRRAANGKLSMDVGFYSGLVPGSETSVAELIDAGALGIKAFLCHSGIDEFPAATERELRAAMPVLAERDKPLLVHAELVSPAPAMSNPRSYADYLATRPPKFEQDAIAMMIELCRETGCRTHIVHLADAGSLPLIRAARAEGLPLTVETCPHYLYFASETIPDGACQFKCAPPIRDSANRELLWQAFEAGDIDFIASDHSPCPPADKRLDEGRFDLAWGGISSIQLTLPIVWTLAKQRGIGLQRLAQWLSVAPARFIGRSAGIEVGNEANLVAFDTEATFTVHGNELLHRVMSQKFIEQFNSLPLAESNEKLLACCGSKWWSDQMIDARPHGSIDELHTAADDVFDRMPRDAWLEAIGSHPRIGDLESLKMKFAGNRQWSSGEQSGVSAADEQVLMRLKTGNDAYYDKFGYTFVVCATGKSASEMLQILESRLTNEPDAELQTAAAEQREITHLRIDKLAADYDH